MKSANATGKNLVPMACGLILVKQCRLFAEIHPGGVLGMPTLLAASLRTGWIPGGPVPENRKALRLTTALRNVGVGLVIATGSFARTSAVTAVVTYAVFEIVGSLLLAMWWGRQSPRT
jgi:BASS family bile acid:Na+ symporter